MCKLMYIDSGRNAATATWLNLAWLAWVEYYTTMNRIRRKASRWMVFRTTDLHLLRYILVALKPGNIGLSRNYR